MPAESSSVGGQPIRSATRLGLAGALLVYLGLVSVWLVTQPLFLTGDESSNVDYAFQVTHGRIPVEGGPRTVEFPGLRQREGLQYTSNHPPAYHALVGPLVLAADASPHPRVFLMLARALTALLGGAALLTLAALAGTVFRAPRERALAVVATVGLSGSWAALVSVSTSIRNDALAVLLVCATVLVLARAARSGQRQGTVLLVASLCALGMLTRVSFLPVWLLAIASVAALEAWPSLRRRRPGAADLRRGVLAALVVLLLPVLAAGWFYALSLHRYGDLTGGSVAYSVVADRPYLPGAESGPLAYMLRPSTWWEQVEQLGGGIVPLAGHTDLVNPVVGALAVAVLVVAVVAAALGRTRLRLLDRPARWTVVGLALVAAAAYAEMAWHVSHKGVDSQRYLLNGVGFWAIGSTIVLLSAPRRLVPYLVTALAALLSIGSLMAAVGSLRHRAEPHAGWFEALVQGTARAGFPAQHVLVVGPMLVVALGLGLQLVALRRLCRLPVPPGPHGLA
jgi:hypothetical protein